MLRKSLRVFNQSNMRAPRFDIFAAGTLRNICVTGMLGNICVTNARQQVQALPEQRQQVSLNVDEQLYQIAPGEIPGKLSREEYIECGTVWPWGELGAVQLARQSLK